jgi:division protein CdvB (Snf7/Vps24/ESCRT-III family)
MSGALQLIEELKTSNCFKEFDETKHQICKVLDDAKSYIESLQSRDNVQIHTILRDQNNALKNKLKMSYDSIRDMDIELSRINYDLLTANNRLNYYKSRYNKMKSKENEGGLK